MYKDRAIAVVIPMYNEEKMIGRVLSTMPDLVDKIVVVNDKSRDNSIQAVEAFRPKLGKRLVLLHTDRNSGCGGALALGYKWARDNGVDVAVRMDGDGQMDPEDLCVLLDPVVSGLVDYAKGNRLFTGEAYKKIPKVRYFGNAILSLLTKIASGYWHIADSQSGYTAISLRALQTIDWDQMYKRYGQPNDLLVRLNIYNFKVADVPVRPVYNIGEKSKMSIPVVTISISVLLLKLFLWRIKEKYIIRDFHPLIFFYLLGGMLLLVSILLLTKALTHKILLGFFPPITSLSWMFCVSIGLQSLFFAMWFDMDYNRALR